MTTPLTPKQTAAADQFYAATTQTLDGVAAMLAVAVVRLVKGQR